MNSATRDRDTIHLRLNTYDRASSVLSASLLVVAVCVALMFLAWLFLANQQSSAIPFVADLDSKEESLELRKGLEDEPEEPGDDFPEPKQMSFADALEALTEIATSVAANTAVVDGPTEASRGNSPGDTRKRGPDIRDTPGGVTSSKSKWRVDFEVENIKEYSDLLDHFEIELSTFDLRDGSMNYLSKLSTSNPKLRTGSRKNENRPFLGEPAKRTIQQWNRSLLKNSNVEIERGRTVIVMMLSEDFRETLSKLERQLIQQHDLKQDVIRATYFSIRKTDDGYDVSVSKLKLRDGKTVGANVK